jgi:uncharacterized OB-fold protein
MSGPAAQRPAPILTEDNHEYWDAAKEGRLVAQRCSECSRLRHPPRPMCPACHSLGHTVTDLAGTGVVYSYSILHYPEFPGFTYPVIAALIDLDEGVRVLSNLVNIEPGDVRVGLTVAMQGCEATKDGGAVPVFGPRGRRQ